MTASTAVDVDVCFLPMYAPDLNPVKPLWKTLKCDRLIEIGLEILPRLYEYADLSDEESLNAVS